MVFSPNIIKSTLNLGNGPAEPSKYLVVIMPCAAMGSSLVGFGTALSIGGTFHLATMAEAVNLPGKQITTTPFTMYGTETKMPFGVAYSDLNITFNCTNHMLERRYFDWWHRLISDPTNNYWNYYDDYVTNITIYKLPPGFSGGGAASAFGFLESLVSVYTVHIEEAYPIAIADQELNFDSEGILKLTVSFAYRRFRTAEDKAFAGESVSLDQAGKAFIAGKRPTPPSSQPVNTDGSTIPSKTGNKT